MNKAVFLDKDGTIVENVPYNVSPELIVLDKDAVEALLMLQEMDYLLIVVSNQAGIAKGFFTEKELAKANQHLAALLLQQGVKIDAFYHCPHHPDGIIAEYAVKCSCRKPAPGLIQQAAEEFAVDLSRSWMIGDILNDVEAGKRAGCRTILYNNGNETEWLPGKYRTPDYTVRSLRKAAAVIGQVEKLLNSANYV